MFANRFALITALSVVCAVTLVAQQQQPPRFAGGTDAILVDVQVTRNGTTVEGLTAADFTIKDSGVQQTAQLVSAGSLPVSLLLAFDTSASVRGTPLEHLKEAAKAAVASLRPGDEAALLTFSHNLLLRANWTTSRENITKAIDSVQGQGLTALNDAAFAALAMTPKPGTRRLVLFFTDGDDTSSWISSADLIQLARRSNAIVYNVTLDATGNAGAMMSKLLERKQTPTDHPRTDVEQWVGAEPGLYRAATLSLVSSETGGESLRAADTASLKASFVDIMARFGKRYILAYTPSGVPPTGWHPIDVEVKGGGDVNARRGYTK